MDNGKRAGGTKKKARRRRTRKTGIHFNLPIQLNSRYALIAGAALVLILVLIFGIRSCGASHKNPERVVKELIESYANGKERKVKDCYGAKKNTPDELQAEIDATFKYFKAHNPQELIIESCEALYQEKNLTYVYIIYKLQLENGQEYPCISTYMTQLRDDKYYVLSPAEVTEEMSEQAATAYAKFMTTNTYKNYVTDYETFIKKNPGYEEKIAGKVS